ncbi:MAG: hypothetical protein WCK65_04195 [Rhodospirillaceae bacterium]
MSAVVVDQLKPLLQRLLTIAESHDERLARLEAAHSRLGNQIARVGEQLAKQSDQLMRLEVIESAPAPPSPLPSPPPPPPPSLPPSSPPPPTVSVLPPRVGMSAFVEAGATGRFGEQVGRINEQITRVREQLGRMVDQLSRIERAQSDLRTEGTIHNQEQRQLLGSVEVGLVSHGQGLEKLGEGLVKLSEGQDKLCEFQDKLGEGQDKLVEGQDKLGDGLDKLGEGQDRLRDTQDKLPDRLQRRVEAVLGVAPFDVEDEGHVIEDVPSELSVVHEEVRQLGSRITELAAKLGKLGQASETLPPKAAASARPAAAKLGVRPLAGSRVTSR